MGGGGAMRAAAKVASFGVNGGLRGVPSVPLAEQSMATASRMTSRPSNSIVSSVATEQGRSSLLLSSPNGKIDASVQRPLWEIDDWEFAGGEDDLLLDSTAPMPRVVFGGVPTLEEAKEATCDLKDALDQVYFSPNSTGGSETKACITNETVVANTSVPKHAIQAFLLLKESSTAQSAVASLASDKNVWDAVMQNEKVMEFFQTQQTSALSHDMDVNDKESAAYNEFNDRESIKKMDYESDGESSGSSASRFMGFMENIKFTATEMVKNVSDFIQSLFGGLGAGNASADEKGSASSGVPMDKVMGASFMGLAVLAIMVVVLKRG
ncbi:uncharacterized protein LOC122066881 [Macadamia integrifolia]|uniref:uncharacterized protein LOC122066881 n=1 Tax=Macadamia integrifolia TaxID=60698 RepID=UPI001C4E6221|nr:uncharacterized protein LOC122066881 [Macadamia integrifolia]